MFGICYFSGVDIVWIILASVLLLTGITGCFLPLLPGPPLSYAGLLVSQLISEPLFSMQFMVAWGAIVIAVSIAEYLIPVYWTKKLGGSRYGIWGCMAGFIAGIWVGPWGIIFGPMIGAFLGELISNNQSGAFKAAVGSFIGFLFSTLLKLAACLTMALYFVWALIAT